MPPRKLVTKFRGKEELHIQAHNYAQTDKLISSHLALTV